MHERKNIQKESRNEATNIGLSKGSPVIVNVSLWPKSESTTAD